MDEKLFKGIFKIRNLEILDLNVDIMSNSNRDNFF